MDDLFEKMMESQQLKRGRKPRATRQKSDEDDTGRLEGALLREALGGSYLGGGGADNAWLDLDHALAAKGEVEWSGERDEEDRPKEGEEEFSE